MARVSNIDTLSAFLDRLITERIKWYFFVKENDIEKVNHQKLVILEIRQKIAKLLLALTEEKVDILQERRTFHLLNDIEKLTIFDIEIGESDRERLRLVQEVDKQFRELHWDRNLEEVAASFAQQEERLRTANENRSQTKNHIDELTDEIF